MCARTWRESEVYEMHARTVLNFFKYVIIFFVFLNDFYLSHSHSHSHTDTHAHTVVVLYDWWQSRGQAASMPVCLFVRQYRSMCEIIC